MQRTVFRSDTQATDSTFSGWTANSAATNGAAPHESGRLRQQKEQQHHVDGVPEDALGVMSSGPQSEQLHVQHVRKPRQRMPIGFRGRSESPRHAAVGQALLDVEVRGDIRGIVVVDESILQCRIIENQSAQEEQERDERNDSFMLRHYYFLAGGEVARIVLN